MRQAFLLVILCCFMVSCGGPSPAETRRVEKHRQDSIALTEQERTLVYYQSQLDSLLPIADSLLTLFKYEKKDPKYQDHGFYVTTSRGGTLRILVREDGQEPVMLYLNGKRIETADDKAVIQAEHLHTTIRDIKELEFRIKKTSLEIEKYQKRLNKG